MCAITNATRTTPVTAMTIFLPIAESQNSVSLFGVSAIGRCAACAPPRATDLVSATNNPMGSLLFKRYEPGLPECARASQVRTDQRGFLSLRAPDRLMPLADAEAFQ